MGDLPEISREALQELSKETLIDIILFQSEQIARNKDRIDSLEARLNDNSSNSNRPPSSDAPFKKPVKAAGKKGKPGGKKGHKGHRQQMLEPTKTEPVVPMLCPCGCDTYDELSPFYTHQHIELPEIEMQITHFVLYKGRCAGCGKMNKAYVPIEYRSGFGPRMTAVIAELAGITATAEPSSRVSALLYWGSPFL